LGLRPKPRLLARGDPYTPLRFVAGARVRAVKRTTYQSTIASMNQPSDARSRKIR
jgi:hypothetical protein